MDSASESPEAIEAKSDVDKWKQILESDGKWCPNKGAAAVAWRKRCNEDPTFLEKHKVVWILLLLQLKLDIII